MRCHALLALLLTGGCFALADDQPQPKKPPLKPPDLLRGGADEFIKKLDKDGDGFLTKEELPPRLAEAFARFDLNKDGKLDKKEVEAMLAVISKQFGKPGGPPTGMKAEGLVKLWLDEFDKDKDGRISKDEARGPLAQGFARMDLNQDGFLDRKELTAAAERIIAMRASGDSGRPDFDALDKDADGRLSRDELKGTAFEKQFDAMDTNQDGKIDRKEFAAFLKKQAARKDQ
jgi:Ca2+-binding EF-hand superfamily protein